MSRDSLVDPEAWTLLSQKLSPRRRQRIEETARKRTRYIRLVIQDVHDNHNVSACLRTAEALGIANVDVVTLSKSGFAPSGPSRGAANWLDIKKWRSVKECAESLHKDGYLLAAGFPDQDAVSLNEVSLARPIAVVMGNEHEGVHHEWLPFIDIRYTIPMVGMVESYNISVAAALSLYDLRTRAAKAVKPEQFYLNDGDVHSLLCRWAHRHSRFPELELQRLKQAKSAKDAGSV